MRKAPGLEDPADLATKYLPRDKIDKCCGLLGYSLVDGRSETTANLHSVDGGVDSGASPPRTTTVSYTHLTLPTNDLV